MTNTQIPLTMVAIAEFLHSQQFQVTIQEEIENLAPTQVLVMIGKAINGQDLVLRIAPVAKAGSFLSSGDEKETETPFLSLQFTVMMPQLVKEECIAELARYILICNANLDMAGFGLMEQEKVFFYRKSHLFPLSGIDSAILLALVSSAQFLVELFSQPLIEIATGKKNIKALQEEAKKVLADFEFSRLA
jgi:hypothetical protein